MSEIDGPHVQGYGRSEPPAQSTSEILAVDGPRITPRGDWAHRGCPTCGDVFQWPLSRAEESTYCNHTGKLNFGSVVQVDSGWTQTVPVAVLRVD